MSLPDAHPISFHCVENRGHLGQTNSHIFLHYCEDDVVLVCKESVYLADADRRFFRQFSRCCRIKALRTPPPPAPQDPGNGGATEPLIVRRDRECPRTKKGTGTCWGRGV